MAREWTVGIDFGGTRVKAGLVNRRGRVVRTTTLPTRQIGRPQQFVPAISRAIEGLAQAVGVRPNRLGGVGIGAPGLIDVRRGMVHHLVNVRGWREVPLARILTKRLGCRCLVDNDVNLVTLGEWRCGAGRGARHMVCLTLGTGVGGGLIINDRLYRGASGAAGEFGHMVVVPGGRRCACGNRGCLEAQLSTVVIVSEARAAMRRGARTLRRVVRQAQGRVTPEAVCRAARAGDRAAMQIWTRFGGWLGIGVANLLNILNPDRVVIGGGVANAWSLLSPSFRRALRANAMDVPARSARVVRGALGDEAGIIGGAVLVWERASGGTKA